MKNLAYYAAFLPDDGKISVLFPDVDGCQTWGDDMAEAVARAAEALEGHLTALVSDDDPLPAASDHDEAWDKLRALLVELEEDLPADTRMQLVVVPSVQEPPVRVNVSFRRAQLKMIDSKAEQAGMTRSGFLVHAATVYNPT